MNGRRSLSRKPTARSLNRRHKTPKTTDQTTMLDVGDWTFAQDQDGALIIHNVMTGQRLVVAAAEPTEE